MERKIKQIIRQVGDIGEKLSSLSAEESLPSIEVDIILGDIRALYEDVKDLQKIPGEIPVPEMESETESTTGQETRAVSSVTQENPDTGSFPPRETRSEPVTSGKEASPGPAVSEKKAVTHEKPPKPGSSKKTSEPAILADKYKGDKKFINETLAGGKENISSKIQSKPISNIGSALGVNDRFKLINDLFNGDKESYQNTIVVLEGASNFNEAFNYITSSFDWDMEEDSVQLLLELVRRKFIVNQDE